jgi:hypothetical protein
MSAKEAVKIVKKILDAAELDPVEVEDGTGFRVGFKGDGPRASGVAYVLPDSERFLFYIELLDRVPKKRRPLVAEFITRANFGITIGNFEMDYSSGGLRYKTSIDFRDATLPGEFVRNAILAAMDSLEVYWDALKSVIEGEQEPEDAIREVEEPLEA